jgi:hypothetical protein
MEFGPSQLLFPENKKSPFPTYLGTRLIAVPPFLAAAVSATRSRTDNAVYAALATVFCFEAFHKAV